MALPQEEAFIQLGPWTKGSNNIAREDSIPPDQVRSAFNIDFEQTGKIRIRNGQALSQSIGGACNLWSDGSYAMFQAGRTLYQYTPGMGPISLYVGLDIDAYLAYCSVNQYIYVSDGFVALQVSPQDNSVRTWGIAAPDGQSIVTSTTNGGMDAGTYQVAITYVTASGEESGTGLAATVTVPTGGGILLSAVPQSLESQVAFISVYMSRANGEELYNYPTLFPIGTTSIQLYNQLLGKRLRSQFLQQFPACSFAALAMGRLFGTQGSLLLFSQPNYYGQYNPATDYIPYAAAIDLLAPTKIGANAEGIFVASGDRTYFLGGAQPTDFNNEVAYTSGVVPGSLTYVGASYFTGLNSDASIDIRRKVNHPIPVWVATNGTICAGLPSGSVLPLTEGRFAAAVGSRGTSFFREISGIRQAVFAMEPPTEGSRVTSTDSVTVTVMRNGVMI